MRQHHLMLAAPAVGILIVASALANGLFGWSLGAAAIERVIFAGASVAFDALKAVLPVAAVLLWRRRLYPLVIVALALWLGLAAYSLAAAIGFAAQARGQAVAETAAVIDRRADLSAELERVNAKRDALPAHRPAAVLRAKVNAGGVVPVDIWRRTSGCTDVTIEESRQACAPWQALKAELRAAETAQKLADRASGLRAARDALPSVNERADPQAAAIAGLSGLTPQTVRDIIAALLAVLIEAGSGLGLTLIAFARAPERPSPDARHDADAFGAGGGLDPETARMPRPVSPEKARRDRQLAALARIAGTPMGNAPEAFIQDPIGQWLLTRLDLKPGAKTPFSALAADFEAWSRARNLPNVTSHRLGRRLKAFAASAGASAVKVATGTEYRGIALAEAPRKKPASAKS